MRNLPTLRRPLALFLAISLTFNIAAPALAKTVDELVGVAAITRLNLQRIAVQQAALALAAESKDSDGDGVIESPAMQTGAGPAGGGLIPLSSAAPKDDSYGTKLGYCAFDNGSATGMSGHIPGAASNAAAPVLAVISAGADNVFQTKCTDIAAAVAAGTGTGVKGDDFAISYNSTQLKLGNAGTLYFGDPVADASALAALASNPSVLHLGEVRLTKNDNVLHTWNGTSWVDVSAAPWKASVAGTPGAYFSSAPIVIGADQAATNRLTVTDSAAPLGLQSSGASNGIQFYAPGAGGVNGFVGVDNGSGALQLQPADGAAIKFGSPSTVFGTLDASGFVLNGKLAASGIVSATMGAVAAPGFAFAGHADTGLYMPAAGALSVTVGGVRHMVLEPNSVGVGANALAALALGGGGNVAVGPGSLSNLTTGSGNVAVGNVAGQLLTTGSSNTFLGAGAGAAGAAASLSFMSALGAGATVSTANTVVLGRPGDKTVLGATGDSGAAALLQINGASQHLGLSTPPPGSAGMLYFNSSLGRFQYNNGVVWGDLTYGATLPLSSITAAIAANTIANGAYAQAWNWRLAGNTTGFALGESAASTGGSGTQYLATIGTLAGSTAIPLSVSTRGVEAFHVDSVNAQTQFARGTSAAPSIAFSAANTTGLYLDSHNQLGIASQGRQIFYYDGLNMGMGDSALNSLSTGAQNTTFGILSLSSNTTGTSNVAFGMGGLSANISGNWNVAVGASAMKNTTTGSSDVAVGYQALVNMNDNANVAVGYFAGSPHTLGNNNTFIGYWAGRNDVNVLAGSGITLLGANTNASLAALNNGSLHMTAVGADSTVATVNTVVLGRATDRTVIGATSDNGSGNALQVTGGLQVASGGLTVSAGQQLVPAGAVGAPSFSFGGNTNSGMYAPAAGQIGLAAGGTRVLAADGTGMTALGAGATVASANTIVLGRATDSVVIGASSAGAYQFTVNGTAGGTSAYAVSSDRRFKRHIAALAHPLDIIRQLQGVSYEFNREAFPERKFESGRQIGFIAQQIEPFVPEVVRTDANGYKSVQYSQLVPLLVEGIKAQQDVLQHFSKADHDTLALGIKTFQAQDVIAANFTAATVRTAALEAEHARIKRLEADSIDAKSLRSDVVKTGETAVFVAAGMFQPVFEPVDNAQYLVNAVADDGTIAFASVAMISGSVIVKPVSGTTVDIVAHGRWIGLVAPNMHVKVSWIRMT